MAYDALVGTPPSIFERARPRFAVLMETGGLVPTRAEYSEAAFGSALMEYRGARGALRLVWDGKGAALFAEALIEGRWTDVEALEAGMTLPFDHDQPDERIARILRAAAAALLRLP